MSYLPHQLVIIFPEYPQPWSPVPALGNRCCHIKWTAPSFDKRSTLAIPSLFSLTGRKGLLQLVGLVRVGNAQSVQVLGAADLELGDTVALLDLHALGVLSASGQEELLDIVDLLGLWTQKKEG